MMQGTFGSVVESGIENLVSAHRNNGGLLTPAECCSAPRRRFAQRNDKCFRKRGASAGAAYLCTLSKVRI